MTKTIIAITGEMASGKGTVAKMLADFYGARHVSYSGILRDMLRALSVPETRESISALSTFVRTHFGQDILAHAVAARIADSTEELFVVEAIRRDEDLIALSPLGDVILLYVDIPLEVRYSRLHARRENADDATKTFEEFVHDQDNEPEQRIRYLKQRAAVVLMNDGSPEDLAVKLSAALVSYGIKK